MPNSEVDQLKLERSQLLKQLQDLKNTTSIRSDYVPLTLTHFLPLFLGLMLFGFLVDIIQIGMASWTNFMFGAIVVILQMLLKDTIYKATKISKN